MEELFYGIWAPIVLRCSRGQILIVSLLAIVACPALRALFHTPSYQECFSFVCRFDTLMMGSLLSFAVLACQRGQIRWSMLRRSLNAAALLSLLCLVPLCICSGLLNHMELRSALSFSVFGYSLLAIFFASIVGLCTIHAERRLWWAAILRARPLVYIGTISYTMYLIHIPVWVTIYMLISILQGREATPGLWVILLSVAMTIALAAISWRFVEKPILRYKDAVFANRQSER